jgi:hypothetical protein
MATTSNTSTSTLSLTPKPTITYHRWNPSFEAPQRVNIQQAEYAQLVVPDSDLDRRAARLALEADAKSRGIKGACLPMERDFMFTASTGECLALVKFRFRKDATAVDLDAVKALLASK